MHIAYLINHLGRTGVNNVVMDLVKQMTVYKHQCCVCYFEDIDNPQVYPCETKCLNREDLDFSAYDIIHTHGLKANLYVLQHKPRLCRAKCVATLHCYVFQDFKDLFGTIKGFLLSFLFLLSVIRHDKVIALSKDAMLYYSRWIKREILTYAYNTCDIDTAMGLSLTEKEEISAFRGNDILIGMNCVLLIRKGVDVMLKAMKLLPDNYKLFVVGDGKEKETFAAMMHKYGLERRVCFAGRRQEAYRYLPFYGISALPSRSEGFPLALLEAAAYSSKVVSSRLPVIEECFSDREIIKFDMSSENDLAKAIIKAMADNGLGERLKTRFYTDYSPTRFAHRYLSIYHTVMEGDYSDDN